MSSLRARTKVDSIQGNHEQAPRIKDTVSTTHESSHNEIDHLCDNAPLPGCEPPHPSEQGADARSADLVQGHSRSYQLQINFEHCPECVRT